LLTELFAPDPIIVIIPLPFFIMQQQHTHMAMMMTMPMTQAMMAPTLASSMSSTCSFLALSPADEGLA